MQLGVHLPMSWALLAAPALGRTPLAGRNTNTAQAAATPQLQQHRHCTYPPYQARLLGPSHPTGPNGAVALEVGQRVTARP